MFCDRTTSPFQNWTTAKRRADLFARLELEAGQLLAAADAQPVSLVAAELRGPLARPAEHHDDALPRPGDVEVRHVAVGRAAAGGRDPLRRLGPQRRGVRLVVVRPGRAARVVMQRELALLAAAEPRVDGLDVRQQGRVGGARVPEVQRPFDGGKVVILDGHGPDDQSGLGVGVGEGVLGALVVELAMLAFRPPLCEQSGGGSAVVDKRERRVGRRAGVLVDERQVSQPDDRAVVQDGLRLGPVRLIAGNAVARIADFQGEFGGPAEVHADRDAGHALAQHLRTERLLASDADGEHDAAPAADGLRDSSRRRRRR